MLPWQLLKISYFISTINKSKSSTEMTNQMKQKMTKVN